MGWFDKQVAGRDPATVTREHARYIRAAGVDKALGALSGPVGVRRYVVRFRAQGGAARVESIEAIPLVFGGGPPPPDPRGRNLQTLERALTALHRNMLTGPRWDRGVVAVLRDAQGEMEIIPTFEDDADQVQVDDLPVPGPPGHPLESREYQLDLERYAHDLGLVHQQTHATSMDWDWWEVEDDGTVIVHWDGPPSRAVRHRGRVLGTFEPRRSRWTWQTPEPLFVGPACETNPFPATLDAAMELGLLMTARLGGRWLFAGGFDDHGGQLLVAVLR